MCYIKEGGFNMKFLHTMIRVKDIEKSLKFYTEVFDMELEHKKRLEDCTLYFLNDKEKTCQIELTYNDDTPKEGYELGNGFGHFAFSVESLDEFSKKIEELGYSYLYPPFDLNGKGSNIAFIKDPDGYEIELIEKVVW
jgi:lactoylglutathione lyase